MMKIKLKRFLGNERGFVPAYFMEFFAVLVFCFIFAALVWWFELPMKWIVVIVVIIITAFLSPLLFSILNILFTYKRDKSD